MLSRLQDRIASIVSGLVEAEGFALAGGAALIVWGEVERASDDLDYFAPTPDRVAVLVPALERELQRAGLEVHRVLDLEGFTRLVVTDGAETTGVDVGYDPHPAARANPPRPGAHRRGAGGGQDLGAVRTG